MGKEEKREKRKNCVHQFKIIFCEKLDIAKFIAISHYEIQAKMALLDFDIIIKCLVLQTKSYDFPLL